MSCGPQSPGSGDGSMTFGVRSPVRSTAKHWGDAPVECRRRRASAMSPFPVPSMAGPFPFDSASSKMATYVRLYGRVPSLRFAKLRVGQEQMRPYPSNGVSSAALVDMTFLTTPDEYKRYWFVPTGRHRGGPTISVVRCRLPAAIAASFSPMAGPVRSPVTSLALRP